MRNRKHTQANEGPLQDGRAKAVERVNVYQPQDAHEESGKS